MKNLEAKIVHKAFFFGILLFVVLLFFVEIRNALGVLLGTLTSILNFRLLGRSIKKIDAKKPARHIKRYFFLHYTSRYGIIAVILYLSYLKKGLGFFIAVVVGLFMVHLSIFINTLFTRQNAK